MELVRRVLTLQEAERRRIARDIHDDLGEQVTALRLKLEWLAARSAEDEELGGRVRAVQEAAERVDQHIDFLLRDLRPAGLEELGLLAVLRQTVADWSATFGITATFRAVGVDAGRPPHEIETQAFRIVQEALNNVHKHAAATQVKVALERRRGRTILTVATTASGWWLVGVGAAGGAAPRSRPARHARAGDADRRSAGHQLDARQGHHRHATASLIRRAAPPSPPPPSARCGSLPARLPRHPGTRARRSAPSPRRRCARAGRAAIAVRLEELDGLRVERRDGVGEDVQAVEERGRDVGQHHVQLELPGHAGHRDRHVVADHVEAHHIQHLGDHRVDLAGMIDEPGCSAGSAISSKPVCGPELRSRRSSAILLSSTASPRSAPDRATKSPMLCCEAIRSAPRAAAVR